MNAPRIIIFLLVCALQLETAFPFIPSLGSTRSLLHRKSSTQVAAAGNGDDIEFLKAELKAYMQKREEVGADELAKKEIGKSVGGTKGNVVLEYISGAPVKEQIRDAPPNPLDYDELTKYGYGHLVTPIMNAGGRLAFYEKLGLDPPAVRMKPKPRSRKIVIDREGTTDKGRYSGLKLGLVMDDSLQAEVLEKVDSKVKAGEEVRSKIEEEYYKRPSNNERSSSLRRTDSAAERLDALVKQQGQTAAWARKAKRESLVKDADESLELSVEQRAYSILTALLFTTAFGKSTQPFLLDIVKIQQSPDDITAFLTTLQAPALALFLASIGSSVVCALQATGKNRSRYIWFVKGLFGGPLVVRSLRVAPPLLTRGELDDKEQQESGNSQ